MNFKKISLYLLYSLIIVAVYYTAGLVTKLVILTPTFAAPIWPAAGFGVGVLILWGYRYIPAIMLGELLINYRFYHLDPLFDQLSIAVIYIPMLIAAILRSSLGAYLVRKYLGKSNNFLTFKSIVKLVLFAGLIPTFISTSISTFVLVSNNLIPLESVFLNFMTWWYGDVVGVFIMLPLMLLIFKKPRNIWRPRLYKTAVPVIFCFILLIIIFHQIKQYENEKIVTALEKQISLLAETVFESTSNDSLNLHGGNHSDFTESLNDLFKNNSEQIIKKYNLEDLHFIIYQISKDAKTKVFESANNLHRSSTWTAKVSFEFGRFQWEIVAYTTAKFHHKNSNWIMWWLLSIGFLFIALIGLGLLIITGNNILIHEKVTQRTKEIETLNQYLIDSEDKYKQLIEIQPVIFWQHIYGDSKLDFVNKEAKNILGYKKTELLNLELIFDKVCHPHDKDRILNEYKQGVESGQRFTLKYRAITKSGQTLWFKNFISTKIIDSKINILGLKVDITNEVKKEQAITQLALFDTMTKLPNRVNFMRSLHKAVKKSILNATYGAIIYLDLDRFKILNDSMGHYYGDKLLIQIAKRLTQLLRSNDVASRFGGDEFVILMGNSDKSLELCRDKAQRLAEKIRMLGQEKYNIDDYIFYTSFSIGISIFPHDSNNPNEIIQQADMAMYESKRRGKNTFTFFKKHMQHNANSRLKIEKSLKEALVKEEFEVYYQPIVNSKKETIELEALVRWHHPEEGILMPKTFIKASEETGLILELSEWIFASVFSTVKNWNESSNNQVLPIAINISLFQFNSNKLVEILENMLEKYNINPQLITLELTESITIDYFKHALVKLNKLKKLGFKLAIDDFGTGYSSLNYLTQMPIDTLKLDKSFIANIGNKTNAEKLIAMIITMANQLNLEIIIEGVETEQQFVLLKSLGCNKFQGHLFGQAVKLSDITEIYS